ncbi:MAG TPA: hypothetical protein VEH02_01420, partial [Pseudolabrys sp.]|nr:hypothetical protein [Pseudolabrys sp.]
IVAMAHDVFVSIEEEGCSINKGIRQAGLLTGGTIFDQPRRRGADLPAALRQNAQRLRGRKFPSGKPANKEIDHKALRYSFCGARAALRRRGPSSI